MQGKNLTFSSHPSTRPAIFKEIENTFINPKKNWSVEEFCITLNERLMALEEQISIFSEVKSTEIVSFTEDISKIISKFKFKISEMEKNKLREEVENAILNAQELFVAISKIELMQLLITHCELSNFTKIIKEHQNKINDSKLTKNSLSPSSLRDRNVNKSPDFSLIKSFTSYLSPPQSPISPSSPPSRWAENLLSTPGLIITLSHIRHETELSKIRFYTEIHLPIPDDLLLASERCRFQLDLNLLRFDKDAEKEEIKILKTVLTLVDQLRKEKKNIEKPANPEQIERVKIIELNFFSQRLALLQYRSKQGNIELKGKISEYDIKKIKTDSHHKKQEERTTEQKMKKLKSEILFGEAMVRRIKDFSRLDIDIQSLIFLNKSADDKTTLEKIIAKKIRQKAALNKDILSILPDYKFNRDELKSHEARVKFIRKVLHKSVTQVERLEAEINDYRKRMPSLVQRLLAGVLFEMLHKNLEGFVDRSGKGLDLSGNIQFWARAMTIATPFNKKLQEILKTSGISFPQTSKLLKKSARLSSLFDEENKQDALRQPIADRENYYADKIGFISIELTKEKKFLVALWEQLQRACYHQLKTGEYKDSIISINPEKTLTLLYDQVDRFDKQTLELEAEDIKINPHVEHVHNRLILTDELKFLCGPVCQRDISNFSEWRQFCEKILNPSDGIVNLSSMKVLIQEQIQKIIDITKKMTDFYNPIFSELSKFFLNDIDKFLKTSLLFYLENYYKKKLKEFPKNFVKLDLDSGDNESRRIKIIDFVAYLRGKSTRKKYIFPPLISPPGEIPVFWINTQIKSIFKDLDERKSLGLDRLLSDCLKLLLWRFLLSFAEHKVECLDGKFFDISKEKKQGGIYSDSKFREDSLNHFIATNPSQEAERSLYSCVKRLYYFINKSDLLTVNKLNAFIREEFESERHEAYLLQLKRSYTGRLYRIIENKEINEDEQPKLADFGLKLAKYFPGRSKKWVLLIAELIKDEIQLQISDADQSYQLKLKNTKEKNNHNLIAHRKQQKTFISSLMCYSQSEQEDAHKQLDKIQKILSLCEISNRQQAVRLLLNLADQWNRQNNPIKNVKLKPAENLIEKTPLLMEAKKYMNSFLEIKEILMHPDSFHYDQKDLARQFDDNIFNLPVFSEEETIIQLTEAKDTIIKSFEGVISIAGDLRDYYLAYLKLDIQEKLLLSLKSEVKNNRNLLTTQRFVLENHNDRLINIAQAMARLCREYSISLEELQSKSSGFILSILKDTSRGLSLQDLLARCYIKEPYRWHEIFTHIAVEKNQPLLICLSRLAGGIIYGNADSKESMDLSQGIYVYYPVITLIFSDSESKEDTLTFPELKDFHKTLWAKRLYAIEKLHFILSQSGKPELNSALSHLEVLHKDLLSGAWRRKRIESPKEKMKKTIALNMNLMTSTLELIEKVIGSNGLMDYLRNMEWNIYQNILPHMATLWRWKFDEECSVEFQKLYEIFIDLVDEDPDILKDPFKSGNVKEMLSILENLRTSQNTKIVWLDEIDMQKIYSKTICAVKNTQTPHLDKLPDLFKLKNKPEEFNKKVRERLEHIGILEKNRSIWEKLTKQNVRSLSWLEEVNLEEVKKSSQHPRILVADTNNTPRLDSQFPDLKPFKNQPILFNQRLAKKLEIISDLQAIIIQPRMTNLQQIKDRLKVFYDKFCVTRPRNSDIFTKIGSQLNLYVQKLENIIDSCEEKSCKIQLDNIDQEKKQIARNLKILFPEFNYSESKERGIDQTASDFYQIEKHIQEFMSPFRELFSLPEFEVRQRIEAPEVEESISLELPGTPSSPPISESPHEEGNDDFDKSVDLLRKKNSKKISHLKKKIANLEIRNNQLIEDRRKSQDSLGISSEVFSDCSSERKSDHSSGSLITISFPEPSRKQVLNTFEKKPSSLESLPILSVQLKLYQTALDDAKRDLIQLLKYQEYLAEIVRNLRKTVSVDISTENVAPEHSPANLCIKVSALLEGQKKQLHEQQALELNLVRSLESIRGVIESKKIPDVMQIDWHNSKLESTKDDLKNKDNNILRLTQSYIDLEMKSSDLKNQLFMNVSQKCDEQQEKNLKKMEIACIAKKTSLKSYQQQKGKLLPRSPGYADLTQKIETLESEILKLEALIIEKRKSYVALADNKMTTNQIEVIDNEMKSIRSQILIFANERAKLAFDAENLGQILTQLNSSPVIVLPPEPILPKDISLEYKSTIGAEERQAQLRLQAVTEIEENLQKQIVYNEAGLGVVKDVLYSIKMLFSKDLEDIAQGLLNQLQEMESDFVSDDEYSLWEEQMQLLIKVLQNSIIANAFDKFPDEKLINLEELPDCINNSEIRSYHSILVNSKQQLDKMRQKLILQFNETQVFLSQSLHDRRMEGRTVVPLFNLLFELKSLNKQAYFWNLKASIINEKLKGYFFDPALYSQIKKTYHVIKSKYKNRQLFFDNQQICPNIESQYDKTFMLYSYYGEFKMYADGQSAALKKLEKNELPEPVNNWYSLLYMSVSAEIKAEKVGEEVERYAREFGKAILFKHGEDFKICGFSKGAWKITSLDKNVFLNCRLSFTNRPRSWERDKIDTEIYRHIYLLNAHQHPPLTHAEIFDWCARLEERLKGFLPEQYDLQREIQAEEESSDIRASLLF